MNVAGGFFVVIASDYRVGRARIHPLLLALPSHVGYVAGVRKGSTRLASAGMAADSEAAFQTIGTAYGTAVLGSQNRVTAGQTVL